MATHLISDLNSFGIWEDDHDAFFKERAGLVSAEIEKRIIKQDVDKRPQSELKDDFEEVGTVLTN